MIGAGILLLLAILSSLGDNPSESEIERAVSARIPDKSERAAAAILLKNEEARRAIRTLAIP